MEKAKASIRSITFFSQKNKKMLTVHSRAARMAAQFLENDSSVLCYDTDVKLPSPCVPEEKAGLRASYLSEAWMTDFYIERLDGTHFVAEVVTPEQLTKRAVIEKLELSRRYWKRQEIQDWKIFISRESEGIGTVC